MSIASTSPLFFCSTMHQFGTYPGNRVLYPDEYWAGLKKYRAQVANAIEYSKHFFKMQFLHDVNNLKALTIDFNTFRYHAFGKCLNCNVGCSIDLINDCWSFSVGFNDIFRVSNIEHIRSMEPRTIKLSQPELYCEARSFLI